MKQIKYQNEQKYFICQLVKTSLGLVMMGFGCFLVGWLVWGFGYFFGGDGEVMYIKLLEIKASDLKYHR